MKGPCPNRWTMGPRCRPDTVPQTPIAVKRAGPGKACNWAYLWAFREAGNAAELTRTTVSGLGQGGGHRQRAGGKIILANCDCATDELCDELRNRWLTACGIDRQRGTRLVPKREIVRNL